MVAHQHIGVKLAAEAQQRLPQTLQIALAVLVVQKTQQTIVSPLHHVLRNAGKFETWKSGHARQDRPLPRARDQCKSRPTLIPGANALSEIVPDTFLTKGVRDNLNVPVGDRAAAR